MVADPDSSDFFRAPPKTLDHQTYEAGEVVVVANVTAGAGGRRVLDIVGGHICFHVGLLRVRRTVQHHICGMFQSGK